ncbi:MAG TPA: HAMP domain-containing protein, partial [Burkholderiaceae bacterium]|nr:HAMP domain-containing protein [Burkholderiaceae bacterium]
MDRVSLTVRLTAFYVLASTLLLLGMAAFISSAIQQHFAELDRETLNDKIQLVRGIVANAASLEDLRGRLNDALQSHPGLYVRIDGADGLVLYDTAAFQFPPALLQQPPAAVGQHTSAWHDGQASYQGVVATLAAGAVLKQDARMVAAVDTAHHAHFMADLRHSLWLYVLAGAATSGLLGWWATRAGLTPLRRMKAKAQLVTANKLDQRMDVEAIPVELADLATSLNEMLQRSQTDFGRLSDFSSDLAH